MPEWLEDHRQCRAKVTARRIHALPHSPRRDKTAQKVDSTGLEPVTSRMRSRRRLPTVLQTHSIGRVDDDGHTKADDGIASTKPIGANKGQGKTKKETLDRDGTRTHNPLIRSQKS